MAHVDSIYHRLLQEITSNGDKKPAARAGMPGSTSLFAQQIRFDLRDEFPILTTKKVSFKNIKTELLWFLMGDTNIRYLLENGCNIWNDDAYRHFTTKVNKQIEALAKYERRHVKSLLLDVFLNRDPLDFTLITKEEFLLRLLKNETTVDIEFNDSYGRLDLVYPHQWRNFGVKDDYDACFDGVDQITEVLTSLKTQPFGRRHIVTAWHPADVPYMGLPACHAFVQFNVVDVDGQFYLDCALTQRSCDVFLGLGYNISSYALLTHIFAQILGYKPRYLSMVLNDAHVYDNHLDAVQELLTRDTAKFGTPDLEFSGLFDVVEKFWDNETNSFALDDFLEHLGKRDILFKTDYESYPAIKAPLSVGI
jgi:thymidylate synthase